MPTSSQNQQQLTTVATVDISKEGSLNSPEILCISSPQRITQQLRDLSSSKGTPVNSSDTRGGLISITGGMTLRRRDHILSNKEMRYIIEAPLKKNLDFLWDLRLVKSSTKSSQRARLLLGREGTMFSKVDRLFWMQKLSLAQLWLPKDLILPRIELLKREPQSIPHQEFGEYVLK